MAGLTKREENLVRALSCLDLEKTATNQSVRRAEECETAFVESAQNGWLSDVPKALLELRRQPLNSPSGYDNGKTLINLMNQIANKSASGVTSATQCQNEQQCNRSPITDAEVLGALSPINKQTTMNAQRGLPITHRGSTWIGFMNSVLSPEIYTPNGTATKEDIAAAAQNIRNRRNDASIKDELQACAVAVSGDLPDCSKAGARKGILLQNDNQNIRYDGSKFIGPGSSITVAPTGVKAVQKQ
jgi:hypothetical protein